jgi:hypothetical protein
MTSFLPTRPPRGRLARLGIVLYADERAASLARLCDRAGIDIIWLVERDRLDADPSLVSVVERADAIAGSLERASLGLMVGPADDPDALGGSTAMRGLLEAGRLELAFPSGVDVAAVTGM